MSGFKVEVHTYGDPAGSWSGNAIVHETEEAAIEAAKDLFMRWTAVESWRVVEQAVGFEPAVVATGP